jgi:flagellar assembly factor FliW
MILETALQEQTQQTQLHFPAGLIGLPDFTRFDLMVVPESEPFILMVGPEPEPVEFVAVEPGGLIHDYTLEISDEDAREIGIRSAADNPLVLVIVTIKSLSPQKVTANLMAPIIANRTTGAAKQVVLANYMKYSANYPLIDEAV